MTSRTHHRILHVEDNPANAQLTERILDERPGVELLVTPLGRSALSLAQEHRPDLVLLDLHLPDIPGEQVLEQLQADPVTRGIPVVVVSAGSAHDKEQLLLQAGARAYLTKPFDVDALLALVDEALSG